jgi:hypothetical protein
MNKHVRPEKMLYYNPELIGMREVIHLSNVHHSIVVNKDTRSYAGQRKFSVVYGVGRDDAVGLATRYGLDGPGIDLGSNPGGWRDFPHPFKYALSHLACCVVGTASLSMV